MAHRKLSRQLAILLFLPALIAGGFGNAFATPDLPDADPTDGYGYTYSLEDETWIVADGGTQLNFPDPNDSYAGPLNLGFSFPFYENSYTQVYVSTNGLLTFGSGSAAYVNRPIPWAKTPNDLVAPLWSNLSLQYGRAYFLSLGDHCVVEWEIYDKDLADPTSVLVLNFEAIIYATGDIVFQYANLDEVPNTYSVGIEDAEGFNGLQYLPTLAVGTDIRFTRPGSNRRVKLQPRSQEGFVYDLKAQYPLRIENNGDLGADTYNLAVASSTPGWGASFYNSQTQALLNNTGSLAQGAAIDVTLKVEAPSSALPGDFTTLVFTATSTLDSTRWMTGTVGSAVPVQFAQVFVDGGRGIRLGQYWRKNLIQRSILDNYFGASLSMEAISADAYLVAWEKADPTTGSFTDIRYKLVSRLSGPGLERLLTNGAQLVGPDVTRADARSPAIARASDGSGVGVAWSLLKQRPPGEKDSSVLFAVLDTTGVRLSERFTVTQTGWNSNDHTYDYPNIAVTGDNHYVVCWIDRFGAVSRVYCAAHTFDGQLIHQTTPVQVHTLAVGATSLNDLSMTTLADNHILVTFIEASPGTDPNPDTTKIYYAVVDSAGNPVSGPTAVAGVDGVQPRAVQFGNGDILLAWIGLDGRVAYAYLNSNYIAEPAQVFTHRSLRRADSLSVTLEPQGQAVLTWVDKDERDYLYYAVLDQSRAVRTPPMIFISNPGGEAYYQTSEYGFGNAGYLGVYQTSCPFIRR